MLGRDERSPPTADGDRLPGVKEEGTDLQGGGKVPGVCFEKGTRLLDQSRKEVILRIPTPKTRRQVREFSGATGFCRIWIPGYSQMFQPLYELLTGPEENPLNWTEK